MYHISLTIRAMSPCRWGEWLSAHADGLHLVLLAGHPEQISAIPAPRLAPLLSRGLHRLTLPQVPYRGTLIGWDGWLAALCLPRGMAIAEPGYGMVPHGGVVMGGGDSWEKPGG